MRGNPVWQLLMVAVAFVAMGWPVWQLTRPAQAALVNIVPSAKEIAERKAAAEVSLTLDAEADFAPTPSEFSLSYLGTALLQGKSQAKETIQIRTTVPVDGADLVLHVEWPASTVPTGGTAPAASRVVIHLSDGRQVEKSSWSEDGSPLDTVLSVPGKTADAAP